MLIDLFIFSCLYLYIASVFWILFWHSIWLAILTCLFLAFYLASFLTSYLETLPGIFSDIFYGVLYPQFLLASCSCFLHFLTAFTSLLSWLLSSPHHPNLSISLLFLPPYSLHFPIPFTFVRFSNPRSFQSPNVVISLICQLCIFFTPHFPAFFTSFFACGSYSP